MVASPSPAPPGLAELLEISWLPGHASMTSAGMRRRAEMVYPFSPAHCLTALVSAEGHGLVRRRSAW
jgi:hypothetical protein